MENHTEPWQVASLQNKQISYYCYFLKFLCFVVLGMEPRVWHMLGKCYILSHWFHIFHIFQLGVEFMSLHLLGRATLEPHPELWIFLKIIGGGPVLPFPEAIMMLG
jgi:hypothetical protein